MTHTTTEENLREKQKYYYNVHRYMRTTYGRADICESSTCTGKSKNFDWALKKGCQHEKKRENYMKLCRSCHMKYDWTEEKARIALKGCQTPEAHRKQALTITGRKLSEAVRKRNSDGHKGKKLTYLYKEVYVFKDSVFLAKYETITSAALATGATSGGITECCSKKYPNHYRANGYQFSYIEKLIKT